MGKRKATPIQFALKIPFSRELEKDDIYGVFFRQQRSKAAKKGWKRRKLREAQERKDSPE